eukprot:Awhi_evm1s6309
MHCACNRILEHYYAYKHCCRLFDCLTKEEKGGSGFDIHSRPHAWYADYYWVETYPKHYFFLMPPVSLNYGQDEESLLLFWPSSKMRKRRGRPKTKRYTKGSFFRTQAKQTRASIAKQINANNAVFCQEEYVVELEASASLEEEETEGNTFILNLAYEQIGAEEEGFRQYEDLVVLVDDQEETVSDTI